MPTLGAAEPQQGLLGDGRAPGSPQPLADLVAVLQEHQAGLQGYLTQWLTAQDELISGFRSHARPELPKPGAPPVDLPRDPPAAGQPEPALAAKLLDGSASAVAKTGEADAAPVRRMYPRPPDWGPSPMEGVYELWPDWNIVSPTSEALSKTFSERFTRLRDKRSSDHDGRSDGFHAAKGSFPILHPGSRVKVAWDVLGIVMLAWDIMWIPMLVFSPPRTPFLAALGWTTLGYWTVDIYMSFTTGFYKHDGKLQMRFGPIAFRYLRSWFPVDVLVVGLDWSMILLEWINVSGSGGSEAVGLARMGKVMRVARILRSLRLLRLMKLRQLIYTIEERIKSESIQILSGLVPNVVGLLAINHVIACAWFLVGISTGFPNWVERYELMDEFIGMQYVVALHWSLTQFTPASMSVVPQNFPERVFNVCVLIFAMIVFSSFVSTITTAMTRLRTLSANHVTQQFLLKRFLSENSISRDLAARVTRYIDLVLRLHNKKTDPSKVELLKLLSGPLRIDLQRELFEKYLVTHPYFMDYGATSFGAMSQLCFMAVTKFSISKGDALFRFGADCASMMILTNGALNYRRPKENGGPSFMLNRSTAIEKGTYFCEAVLWLPWAHNGTMTAMIESDLVALDSRKFREVTLAHPGVAWHAREYAFEFLARVQAEVSQHGAVWDLPSHLMYPGDDDGQSDYEDDIKEVKEAHEFEAELIHLDSSDEEIRCTANARVRARKGTDVARLAL